MPRYTDDSRDKVRDAVDFADLVGQRTELRRAGVNRMVGLCPFHDERSPSFGIDPVEKLYHCFGCGAGGDLFTFVMETESLGFGEALELLADRYNVTLERTEEDPGAADRRARRERLHALLERTAAWYVRMLWEAPESEGARAYLASRGLTEGVCREFRVGFSPDAWDRVVSASQRSGYSADELLAAGLASRSRGQSGLVDRFRGRLMFPWADARGRVLGFGARALKEGDNPKYLNSSEGEVFSKGRQVYGTHLARAAAGKAGSVVLVEGYTDVIALHQAGVRNAVGQMGTALTEGQAGELAKLAPSVTLCLDGDSAGQEATLRASGVLRSLKPPADVRVAALPAGSDPADVVAGEGGAAAVADLLERAIPLARWRVELSIARGDLSTEEGRGRVLDQVAPIVNRLPDSPLRSELTRFIGDRLALPTEVVAARLTSTARGRGLGMPPPEDFRRVISYVDDAERGFLAICLALPSSGPIRLAEIDLDTTFSSPLARRAAAHLRDHFDAPATGLPPDDEALSALMAELVMRAHAMEDPDSAQLDRAALLLERARLQRQIASARAAGEPVSELARESQRIVAELGRLTV